jgi:hypothetical protein
VIDVACGDAITVVIAEVEGNPNDKIKKRFEGEDALSLENLRKQITLKVEKDRKIDKANLL